MWVYPIMSVFFSEIKKQPSFSNNRVFNSTNGFQASMKPKKKKKGPAIFEKTKRLDVLKGERWTQCSSSCHHTYCCHHTNTVSLEWMVAELIETKWILWAQCELPAGRGTDGQWRWKWASYGHSTRPTTIYKAATKCL